MSGWILLATAAFACPWARPVSYHPCGELVTVYMPCTPCEVISCVEVKPQAVAKEEESVTDMASAEEEENTLTNVGLSLPAYSLGHMALDWGVGGIGSGSLSASTQFRGGYTGGSFFRGGGDNSVPPPTGGCNHCCPRPPTGPCDDPCDPPPVPEPATIAIWLTGLGLAGAHRYRSRLSASQSV